MAQEKNVAQMGTTDLVRLLSGELKTTEIVVNDIKIVLRLLTQKENEEIFRRFRSGFDLFQFEEVIKIPVLARAIVSINDLPLTGFPDVLAKIEKIKSENNGIVDINAIKEEVLSNIDTPLASLLNNSYHKLRNEVADKLSEQIKN